MTKRGGMLGMLTAMASLAVAGDGTVGNANPIGRVNPNAVPEPGRRTLARITAAPKEPRREMSNEERERMKAERKERRADRMRLRKRRGWR